MSMALLPGFSLPRGYEYETTVRFTGSMWLCKYGGCLHTLRENKPTTALVVIR